MENATQNHSSLRRLLARLRKPHLAPLDEQYLNSDVAAGA